MKLSRQIIHGVALNNVVTLVEMGVGFIQQVFIVRYLLGLTQYGSLAFFQASFGMLAIFFNLNLNYSAIRFGGAAQGREDETEFYRIQGTTFFISLLLYLLLIVVTIFIALLDIKYKGRIVGEYFFLLAINTLLGLPGGFAGTVFMSRKDFKKLSLQQIIGAIATAASVIVVTYYFRTIKGAICGMMVGTLIGSIVSFVMVWKDFFKCRLDFKLIKSMSLYGGQFTLTSIVKQFFWKADIILLGLFTTERAVGLYRVAQTIANPLMRVFSPLWTVLFPTISVESGKGNNENIRKLLFRGTQWLVIGNLPIVIVGSFLLDFLIPKIYGGAEAAIFPVRLLLWGYALGTMTCVSPPILRVFRNDIALSTTLSAAILNILLNLLLIPHLKVTGAALASFISFGLLALVVYYYAFRAIDIPVLPLINAGVVFQILLIGAMMFCSILNHFFAAGVLYLLLIVYLFGQRMVTVKEFKAYLAS